jgi:probable O-glycosylation ligase (exosortase A-associated)
MALLFVVYTRTETELRTLLIIIGASVGILGLKLGLFGFIVGDAQYMDAYTDTMMSDNNMLALALAMAIPLCWYMAGLVTSKLVRMSLFAMAFGLMAGVVMTHSRGGALSAGVALLLIALRSKRKFLTLAVLVMCAAPAVYVVRDTYLARLSTITTNEAEADGSIRSRINHRRAAFAMWKDYPFFGVGFGMENYVLLAPQYLGYDDFHVAHNTYFQILADSGAFAFLIYICLFFGTIVWLERSARAAARDTPGKEVYPLAIQTSLIAFAVGSYFLSRDTYDLLYIVLMAAAAWHTVQTNEAFDLASEDDRHINDSALAVIT